MSKIIDVNGVKFELRDAEVKEVRTYKIGDPVRILRKNYDDKTEVYHGVIIDFIEFDGLPTIEVMYFSNSYNSVEIEVAFVNSKNTQYMIAPASRHVPEIDLSFVTDVINKEIQKKELQIAELKSKLEHFLKKYKEAYNL